MNTTNTNINTEGLSARQVSALRWVAKLGEGVSCNAATLRALKRRGLVETSSPYRARLTDAGRALLARIEVRINAGGRS